MPVRQPGGDADWAVGSASSKERSRLEIQIKESFKLWDSMRSLKLCGYRRKEGSCKTERTNTGGRDGALEPKPILSGPKE